MAEHLRLRQCEIADELAAPGGELAVAGDIVTFQPVEDRITRLPSAEHRDHIIAANRGNSIEERQHH
jgi:hypothetical protein